MNNIEETKSNRNANTIFKEASAKVKETSDYLEVKLSGSKMRMASAFGTGYILTFIYIAPIFKDQFLIASWTNVMFLYLISAGIGVILFFIYSILLKLLLYIFS